MVGGRGNGIGPLGDHTGTGYVSYNFRTWKVSPDTRFCALADFDLNGGTCFQIIRMNAKTAGSYLHDGILSIAVKILMQTAFSGVIKSPVLLPQAQEIYGRCS